MESVTEASLEENKRAVVLGYKVRTILKLAKSITMTTDERLEVLARAFVAACRETGAVDTLAIANLRRMFNQPSPATMPLDDEVSTPRQ